MNGLKGSSDGCASPGCPEVALMSTKAGRQGATKVADVVDLSSHLAPQSIALWRQAPSLSACSGHWS